MRKFGWLTPCAAALVCIGVSAGIAAKAATQPLYWYDGATKTPLFRQPQLDRAPSGPATKLRAARDSASDPASAERGDAGGPPLTAYSTGANPRASRLMRQAPGIVFALDDGASLAPVRAWLAERRLRAEPIASGTLFKVGSITGEHALVLANALFESGLVKYAQPNWVIDLDRHAPPERNIERAMSEALSTPKKRCAALDAAISQAVMDRRGSRTVGPDAHASPGPRSANTALGPNDGRFADKQTSLETEYAKLGCAR
ncbi:hypothetical protein C0Z18_10530 [Trinickia dabaoshanensis]|uniref:Uncharacterized protein n=2 Tax=Trinickia dabaoshanensis TaxID=564714 RepID=A0A2N7VT92_9BURK|nr:hypothetical protein C0Z18_10530 [Trinickia dabaoshanensis]